MIGDINYKLNGASSIGTISLINTTAGQRFLAVTNAASKTFKSFKSAHNFMQNKGYIILK